MRRRNFLATIGLMPFSGSMLFGDEERDRSGAGIVIQFDDGWPNWNKVTAPELKRVRGKATAFVCNQYIDNGRTTVEQLRELQDAYGWEIGSHGYHHVHAPRYVQKHGLEQWLKEEFEASMSALKDAGLMARSLVFPFNAVTPQLAAAVKERVETWRRAEPLGIAPGVRDDGSVPATTIDIAQYTPVNVVESWIDFASRKNEVLFLYGHRILPDSQFTLGTVAGIKGNTITTKDPVNAAEGEELVLVADPMRRADRRGVIRVVAAVDHEIKCDNIAAGALDVGVEFLMGPSYGTRLSDFRAILSHAEGKLPFYTVHEIAAGRHRA